MQFNEPGVFMAFEETAKDLVQNVASLGFDLKDLIARKKIVLDFIYIERGEIEETGEYDLEGLFIRLGQAIASIGAKRVVLDTIESLFSGLPNPLIQRAELRRLFRWLKAKGVTAIITGERGDNALTRQGLEEYVSDCVIVLDHRVNDQVSSRRLRVVKYRGSTHGTNEYPFLIDENGISVLPVTSLGLNHIASSERIPTGVARLDAMLGGAGYYTGSSVLVSGTAGTGKSSLAAHFAEVACRRGERNRGLYILKSRGMAHSNQIREFLLTDHGMELRDVYVGASGVLTGSARLAQEAQEQAGKLTLQQETEHRQLGLERKRKALEAQIAAMRAEFEAQETETLSIIGQERVRGAQLLQERMDMGLSRKADAKPNKQKGGSQ
jgi:KaiC/GvpD/RAD55 family RecA-like ATPase